MTWPTLAKETKTVKVRTVAGPVVAVQNPEKHSTEEPALASISVICPVRKPEKGKGFPGSHRIWFLFFFPWGSEVPVSCLL